MQKQKQFFLSQNGAHVGPYSFEEILKKLEGQDHQWMDYVFDEASREWVMLMEHPQFTDKFNQGHARPKAKPIAPPKEASISQIKPHLEKAWYLLKEGNNFGPFSVVDVVHMLQEKTLFEFDFIWQKGMQTWKRIAEVPEFHHDKIKNMKASSEAEVSEVFFRRRHARARYGCSVIVHDHKKVFRGHSVEISEGGAGLAISQGQFEPGQTLYLHFKPGDDVPPFNAVCTIVSKQWLSANHSEAKYGVKFDGISLTVRESIRDFAQKKGAKAA